MEELSKKVVQGHHFKVSFEDKSCKFDKKMIVENGEFKFDYSFSGSILTELQKLYDEYYYSVPSERSEHNCHTYFKASDELSDTQLILGGNREEKRFNLEMFMLWVICNYKWEDLFDEKHFFYKGQNGLIVLKNWFSK